MNEQWWADFKRDVHVFVHLFPWRMSGVMLIGLTVSTYLFWLAHLHWQGQISLIKALFAIVNMTFFQLAFSDMPEDSRLDIFSIIIPLIGLPLISFFGFRIITILRIFLVRSERGQEWQEAVVQYTVAEHIIICGLGRIGYRVARNLHHDYGKTLVGINDIQTPLVGELIGDGVPVILGNTEREDVLLKAGIKRAKIVIICTHNDWVNLGTAVLIRKLNPGARVILRLFEDELMTEIQAKFNIDTIISSSAVAATTFTYAAVGGQIVETFKLGHKNYILAQVPLGPTSPILGRTIREVAKEQDVTIVCHHRGQTLTVEPDPNLCLSCHDNIFVFTTVTEMIDLIEIGLHTNLAPLRHRGKILVCGLGNIGYRVANKLAELGCQVLGLDFAPTELSPRLAEQQIPLKFGDLRWNALLCEAEISEAIAIVACTEDDMTNLQIALRARSLNPTIQVVIRIFDDQLSEQLRQTFGYNVAVYSTSALAAPTFVAAALNQMNIHRLELGGSKQAIARLHIEEASLRGVPIAQLQREENLMVLLHAHNGQVDIPPEINTSLKVGDEIVVMASEAKVEELNRRN